MVGSKEDMKIRKIKQLIMGLFSMSLLPVFTLATSSPIQVAYILESGFYDIDENGILSGYSYDYLEQLSLHTGWDYEFVLIEEGTLKDSYVKAVELMNQGKVDLLGTAFRNEGTEALFEFPESHTGITRHCLMSLGNNHKITIDNYFLQEMLTVALVEGDAVNHIFTGLFDLRNILYHVTYVDSYEEALALLVAEEVDTMVMTDTSADSGMVNYLTTIDRTPFYFVAEKGNTDLISQLDAGIKALNVVNSAVHQELLEIYFGNSRSDEFIMTEVESQAMAQHEYLNVGMLKNLPPYVTFPEDGTEPYGITIDILNLLTEITGITFRYVWADTRSELTELLEQEEVDLCGIIPSNTDIANEMDILLSKPYMERGTLWLTRDGVATDTAILHLVSGNIPYYRDVQLDREIELESALLDLSKNGNISILCERNVATYYLNRLGIENIEFHAAGNIESNLSFGMGKHVDVAILSMLNNAISYLKPSDIEDSILVHMSSHDEMTVDYFIRKYAKELDILVKVVLFLIVAALLYHSNKFKKLSRQDSMTKLINSGYFHQYAEDNTKKTKSGCLILVDIDLFKEVNDTYGHQKGDEVIQLVAESIQKYFRQGDIVARLGGDEFAVLLENGCKKEDLEKKFHTLLEELSDNPTGIAVSLSIGGYIFHEPIKYKSLYNLADANLYKVKENGRNGFLFS